MKLLRAAAGVGFAVAGLAVAGPGGAVAAAPSCANPLRATAADTSAPLTERFLDAIQRQGVTTVARYYDYPDETLPGKTLTQAERDMVAARGLSLVVVFQHHNDQLASFTTERGAGDAARALELAVAMHQPAGSAIYFGVDGPWRSDADLDRITAYFRAVDTAMAGSGYRVGVYGSGLTCQLMAATGQASLCWLANPTSWPGHDAAVAAGDWAIRQRGQVSCGERFVDFDQLNPAQAYAGQFKP